MEKIDDCAAACKYCDASWFIFATTESGNDKCEGGCCKDKKCKCYCQSGTANPLSCVQHTHEAYHLYSIQGEGNILLTCIQIWDR